MVHEPLMTVAMLTTLAWPASGSVEDFTVESFLSTALIQSDLGGAKSERFITFIVS